jgi:hypothetical protein
MMNKELTIYRRNCTCAICDKSVEIQSYVPFTEEDDCTGIICEDCAEGELGPTAPVPRKCLNCSGQLPSKWASSYCSTDCWLEAGG